MTTTPKLSKEQLIEAANADPTTSPYWVSVLYGDYGNRKTTTAASMVNERGLLLSADDSWKVLLNPRHKELYDKITVTPYQGLSQLQYVKMDNYDTVIWDTVSQSVDMFLDLLHDDVKWSGKNRETAIVSSSNPDIKNLETLGFVDYRATRDAFRPVLNRLFENTEAHIVFTSQMREPIAGMGSNQQRRPDIPQATFKIIGTRADIIAYVKTAGTKATADVTNNLTQLGKSRIEAIQGSMNLDEFIRTYKETVFK